MNQLRVYIDGASRGNPGKSGVGVVFCDENGGIIEEFYKYIGVATNNQAEYSALIFALDAIVLKDYTHRKLHVYLDSEILYKQITGVYRVKDKKLKELFEKARAKIDKFSSVEFEWIPREKNKLANKLSQKAINLTLRPVYRPRRNVGGGNSGLSPALTGQKELNTLRQCSQKLEKVKTIADYPKKLGTKRS